MLIGTFIDTEKKETLLLFPAVIACKLIERKRLHTWKYSVFLFSLQALMLENLQRTSTAHIGLQPNSQVSSSKVLKYKNKC